jgi:hypothetical protein
VSQSGGGRAVRAVRAVFVPANGEVIGLAWLEVIAPVAEGGDAAGDFAEGGWTLTVYATGGRPPRRTRLTAEECRGLVREWKWAAQHGKGTLRIG